MTIGSTNNKMITDALIVLKMLPVRPYVSPTMKQLNISAARKTEGENPVSAAYNHSKVTGIDHRNHLARRFPNTAENNGFNKR